MAKGNEFKWDKETLVKTIEVSDKEKHEVRIAEKNGKTYVSVTELIYFKRDDAFKPVKNRTFELSLFEQVVDAVNDWRMADAFDAGPIRTGTKKAARKK